MSEQKVKISFVKEGKRSYIYKCTKQELQQILLKVNVAYPLNANIVSNYSKNKLMVKMFMYGEINQFDGKKWEDLNNN